MLNSVFLHHCVEAGLDMAIVNPAHITPYAEIPEDERALADDLVFNRRPDALSASSSTSRTKGEEAAEDEKADPTAGMEPEEALHWMILHRKKEGIEDGLDAAVEKIGAGPDAQRSAAAGDEGSRRQVRRRRADPPVRAAVAPR